MQPCCFTPSSFPSSSILSMPALVPRIRSVVGMVEWFQNAAVWWAYRLVSTRLRLYSRFGRSTQYLQGGVIRDLPSPLIQATRLYSVHSFTKPASAGVSLPPQVTKSKVSMPHTSSGMLDFLFGAPGADVRHSKAPSWI